MPEFINEISKIKVPQEIINQVDIKGLLDNFSENFKQLDKFKKTRKQYEERGALKKIWDCARMDDTLDDAQLDAIEVQAKFSKAIGQLMVLSIMMSQKLEQQQCELASQQDMIKKQTTSIERHTQSLGEQQIELGQQNLTLERVLNDYIELKGFTQEGADKLIKIANEVKCTKGELIETVQETLSEALGEIAATKENILSAFDETRQYVRNSLSEIQEDLRLKVQTQDENIAGIDQTLQKYSEKAALQEEHLFSHDKALREIDSKLLAQSELASGLFSTLEGLSGQFAAYQVQTVKNAQRVNILLCISIVCSAVLLGFILYRI